MLSVVYSSAIFYISRMFIKQFCFFKSKLDYFFWYFIYLGTLVPALFVVNIDAVTPASVFAVTVISL